MSASEKEGKTLSTLTKVLLIALAIVAVAGLGTVLVALDRYYSAPRVVTQHDYLKEYGLEEKFTYFLVSADSRRELGRLQDTTPDVTGPLVHEVAEGRVLLALVIDGKRVMVRYPLNQIEWAEQVGASPKAKLWLTKGEGITVDRGTEIRHSIPEKLRVSESDLRSGKANPEKVRQLLLWRERLERYPRVISDKGALIERDAYKITITADPGKIAELKRQAAGQP